MFDVLEIDIMTIITDTNLNRAQTELSNDDKLKTCRSRGIYICTYRATRLHILKINRTFRQPQKHRHPEEKQAASSGESSQREEDIKYLY